MKNKLFTILLALGIGFSPVVQAAISSGGPANNFTNYTWNNGSTFSYSAAACSNAYLLATLDNYDVSGGSCASYSAVSYNGTNMTKLGYRTYGPNQSTAMFGLPITSTDGNAHNLVTTHNGCANTDLSVNLYCGVNQTASPKFLSNGLTTITSTTTVPNSWVMGFSSMVGSAGANTTILTGSSGSNNKLLSYSSNPVASPGSSISLNINTQNSSYQNMFWTELVPTPPENDCTGGTITYTATSTIHTFTTSSTLVCTKSGTARVLVVGGGGAGGSYTGGGGGGGGVTSTDSYLLTPQTYTVNVGAGGAAGNYNTVAPSPGATSTFGTLSAYGGGRGSIGGGADNWAATAGGSGGGGGSRTGKTSGAAGTTGMGFAGGDSAGESGNYGSGGGGGAGQVGGNGGTNGGLGGNGVTSTISGASVVYGGGGGGAVCGTGTYGGGLGGGGKPSINTCATGYTNTLGENGVNGLGGGGGGGSTQIGGFAGGLGGGSGVVIISYLTGGLTTGSSICHFRGIGRCH